MARIDWLGLGLTSILCMLAIYIISSLREYPPIKIEPFVSGASTGIGLSQVPSAIQCSKVALNTNATPNLTQSGGQTWLCADSTNANKLIAGDKSFKPAKPYISRNDLVCISQDEKKTIYTCMDHSMVPGDESPQQGYDDYKTSCDNFYAKYLDISGALSTLKTMKATITENSTTLGTMKATLDGMYIQYKCESITDDSKKIICNAIAQAQGSINKNKGKASDLEGLLMAHIQPALDAKKGLVDTINQYKCDYVLPQGD